MSTTTNPPANPAKGNKRGQTTLAAKIVRWQGMNNNVKAQLDAFPQLKDFQAQFQQIIDQASAIQTQMMTIEADSLSATAQRNQLVSAGDEIFSRLSHGLKSALGPKNERLAQYGVKRGKSGPKSTVVQVSPGPSSPPPVEAQAKPADPSHPVKSQ